MSIAGHEHRYALTRAEIDSLADESDATVSLVDDSETEILAALQRTEPVRFVRSPEDWKAFASLFRLVRPDMPEPLGVMRCWIIRVNGLPVAYVILKIYRSKENRNTAHIVEFAGARRHVFAGIAKIAKDFAVESNRFPETSTAILLCQRLVTTSPHSVDTVPNQHANILNRYRRLLIERSEYRPRNLCQSQRNPAHGHS